MNCIKIPDHNTLDIGQRCLWVDRNITKGLRMNFSRNLFYTWARSQCCCCWWYCYIQRCRHQRLRSLAVMRSSVVSCSFSSHNAHCVGLLWTVYTQFNTIWLEIQCCQVSSWFARSLQVHVTMHVIDLFERLVTFASRLLVKVENFSTIVLRMHLRN